QRGDRPGLRRDDRRRDAAPGLPRAGVSQQEHLALDRRRDVPARGLAAPRRKHALPLDLRGQRRRCARQARLPGVLSAGRPRGGRAAFALAPNSTIPNVGASGAIAAVLGAYIVLYPRARILTVVFFFLITLIELPALVVLGLWF